MVEKKKKPNWFFKILLVLFFLYLSLTLALQTGYYEAKLSEKTILTEEGMKQFEADVSSGKDVDIKDYVSEIHEDYSNKTTKAGVFFAKLMEDMMSEGISKMVDVFKTLFT